MGQDTASSNIKLVHFMSESGFGGRFDAMKPYISDDFVMTLPEGLPYGGVYKGWQGYLDVITKVGGFWQQLSFTPIECAQLGNRVVVTTSLTGSRNGKSVSMPLCEVWEIHSGKVTAITPFYFDTKAVAALSD